jgi:hypothetical protein
VTACLYVYKLFNEKFSAKPLCPVILKSTRRIANGKWAPSNQQMAVSYMKIFLQMLLAKCKVVLVN